MNMKTNNFIIAAVAATLALTSCEKNDELFEDLRSPQVKILKDNSVTTTAISKCTGLDTSWTVGFGVAYVVNIANIPGIDDVRYDEYSFYAMIDGKKIKGFQGVKDQISGIAEGLIDGHFAVEFSGHTDLAVYLLEENMYKAQFFVENSNGQLYEVKLTEVY